MKLNAAFHFIVLGVHNPEIKHFKCKQCPKRYATRSGLTNHSANHSSFKCPTCDLGFNKDTTLQKHMIDFNHFGNVADRSSFNEEELRKSLEEMAKTMGGGAKLPPFPTNIRRAGGGGGSGASGAAPAFSSAATSPSSRRGGVAANVGRPFARPFAQKNSFGGGGVGANRFAPAPRLGPRPFYRPFVGANRPAPFGRPFPKPFQRRVPVPPPEDDGEIEEVVLD